MPTIFLQPETARFAQGAYQFVKKEARGTGVILAVLWGAVGATVAGAWNKGWTWSDLAVELAFPIMVACIAFFAYKGVIALGNIWVQLVYLNERNDWVDQKQGGEDLDLEDDGDS